MDFEFDPIKSEKNKEKHGIDFIEAQSLWNDTRHITIPAKSIGEPRFALIGMYREKIWTTIYTIRTEKIRIISVRRARDGEKKGYYNS